MKSEYVIEALRHALRGDREQLLSTIRMIEASEARTSRVEVPRKLRRLLDQYGGTTGAMVPLPCSSNVIPTTPTKNLSDLLLTDEVQKSLELLKREHDRRELLEENNLSPRSKLLFHGPPGNGKTVAAEAVATMLGVPFLFVDHSQLVDSHLGETGKRIVEIFRDAARQPCVLFIDEIDSIGSTRITDNTAPSKEGNRMVTQLLMSLDGMPPCSTFIGATNRQDCLDPALLRRFDTILEFPPPTGAQLTKFIWLMGQRHPVLIGKHHNIKPGDNRSFAEIESIMRNQARELIVA